MFEGTSIGSAPVRLLPTTIPAPVAPPLGGWHGRGLCVGEDPNLFFPTHGDPATKAREICTACAVRGDCLEYAMEAGEFGIWGGLDQQERRNLRRKRQRRRQAVSARPGKTAQAGETV